MKSNDLIALSVLARSIVTSLEDVGRPVQSARLSAQQDEVHAVFLANVKHALGEVARHAEQLARQCESAANLWSLDESFASVMDEMTQQQEELSKALSGARAHE